MMLRGTGTRLVAAEAGLMAAGARLIQTLLRRVARVEVLEVTQVRGDELRDGLVIPK